MKTDWISYPPNFLSRPCDRLFLIEMGNPLRGNLFAYRIWHDYFVSECDRRELSTDAGGRYSLATDSTARIIENYCEWTGEPGGLVQAAIDAGFLKVVAEEGKTWLVCVDFYPENNQSRFTTPQKGGLAKKYNAMAEEAAMSAGKQLDLFVNKRHEITQENINPEDLKSSMVQLQMIRRALDLPELPYHQWTADLLRKSLVFTKECSNEERVQTCQWLMMRRNDPDIPKRLDLVIDKIGDYVAKAKRDFA